MPVGSNSRDEGFILAHSLSTQSFRVAEAVGGWSHRNPSHEASKCRCSAAFLFLVWDPSPVQWGCPQLGWVFPPQSSQSRNSFALVPKRLLRGDPKSHQVDDQISALYFVSKGIEEYPLPALTSACHDFWILHISLNLTRFWGQA